MKKYIATIILFLGFLTTATAGAKPPQWSDAEPQTPLLPQGYLLHLPGVAGTTLLDRAMVKSLKQGGLEVQTQIYNWTRGDPGINALLAYQRNQKEADKLAEHLIQRLRAEPDTKLYLTGHSGGTGLVVWILERLPEDVQVESVLLLAPALSPQYDLTRALQRVRGKMYVFSSVYDTIVLGTGTKLFGTIDGVKTDAAGRIGFVRPSAGDEKQYEKLIAKPYNAKWMRYGNIGDHIGPIMGAFARNVLAPLLIDGAAAAPPADQPLTAQ